MEAGVKSMSSKKMQKQAYRSSAQTRTLFFEVATAIAIERTGAQGGEGHNILAGIKVADVLAAVNRQHGAARAKPITTGAFYQIWPDQASFQRELLAHVMYQIATPGSETIERLAFELIASGEGGDEVFRRICEADYEETLKSPELLLALGLGALAPIDLVRQAQEESNAAYLELMRRLLTNLLRYSKRRLRQGVAMDDLIWAIEALAVGYLLRGRSHPEIPERKAADGWSARARANLGIVEAFTERDDAADHEAII